MSKPHLKILAVTVLSGLVLTACSSQSSGTENDDALTYIPSADTHPCLDVAVTAPAVLQLSTEATVSVNVENRCDEAVNYTSSVIPYFLQLVSNDDKIVWFAPSEDMPSLPVEYTVLANGTTSYDVAASLPANDVLPGSYKMIASLFVDQIEPNATQYVEDLKLESEPQNVTVGL